MVESFDIQLSENRGSKTAPGNFWVGSEEPGAGDRMRPAQPLEELLVQSNEVELNGIEPSTSGLQSPRSPS